MQGYNVQEADRMSVAIHPSETRPSEARAQARFRLPVVAGVAGGGVALLAFAVGAFSFFSDLADPRTRPARIAPVASQWPDLKDGVPALAPATAGALPEPRRASLPAVPAAEPAPPAPSPAPVAAKEQAAAPVQIAASPPPPARPPLPIEPAPTVPPASRTAAAVAPAKVTVPLPPSRSETVRAKTEQPARFVSLPATAKPEAKVETKLDAKAKTEKDKTEKAEIVKSDPARKAASAARSRPADARPTQTASAQVPAARPAQDAADEPELLGVKIPGGRQIREGWDAAVNGLLGSKSAGE